MADLSSSPYFLLILFIAAFALPLVYLIWIRNSPRYGREPWPTVLKTFAWGRVQRHHRDHPECLVHPRPQLKPVSERFLRAAFPGPEHGNRGARRRTDRGRSRERGRSDRGPSADAIEDRRPRLWRRGGPGVFRDRESGLRARGPSRPGRRALRLARRGRGSVFLLDVPPCELDRGDGLRAGQVLALRPPMGRLPVLLRRGRNACGVQSLLDLGR